MATQTQPPREFWRPGGTVTRALLAQMDGGATTREHWKILVTCGMGFFTDAYDLFIIGVVGTMMTAGFAGLWLIPGATTIVLPFLLLYGVSYFFALFGPNTTTFAGPAELFPVRARASSHGVAAAAGKIGAFAGTYALTALLPAIGLGPVSGLVAAVCLAGLVVTAGRRRRRTS